MWQQMFVSEVVHTNATVNVLPNVKEGRKEGRHKRFEIALGVHEEF